MQTVQTHSYTINILKNKLEYENYFRNLLMSRD